MENAGKLYVISMPLGNLKDITVRSLEMLQAVDFIVAEDTREIGKFLSLQKLPKKALLSYREQNHNRIVDQILASLRAGKNIALVSDRGTPTISDPGYKLVRDVSQAGIDVVTVPGASAAIAALSISGLATDRFVFLGFLPRTRGKQIKLLQKYGELDATFIAYESPFRVKQLLSSIHEALGDIDVALAHELTKLNESMIRGKVSEVESFIKDMTLKGEWVVLGRK